MRAVALSTIDNPYNPFDEWDEWFAFDLREGYRSSELLARLSITSPDLPTTDQLKDLESTIDEIVALNPSGMFVKIVKES